MTKSMGIAIKRRDYAPVVKRVYGGCLDIILNDRDVPGALAFLQNSLQDLVNGKFPLEELVLSKTLAGHYAAPDLIVHKVLADRMRVRDPGSAPQVGDRVPFVYIVPTPAMIAAAAASGRSAGNMLQGDRVEHPAYVTEQGLKPDYAFYVDRQLAKCTCQLFAHVLEQIEGYARPPNYWKAMMQSFTDQGIEPKSARDRVQRARERDVYALLFAPLLQRLAQANAGQRRMDGFLVSSTSACSMTTAESRRITTTPATTPLAKLEQAVVQRKEQKAKTKAKAKAKTKTKASAKAKAQGNSDDGQPTQARTDQGTPVPAPGKN
jgi:hypothetical protein